MLVGFRMLAYRAEDISQRLEPQELYDRQEFEESIQFDVSLYYMCMCWTPFTVTPQVAEECILKWIKKFVQPVLKQQEEGKTSVVSCCTHINACAHIEACVFLSRKSKFVVISLLQEWTQVIKVSHT